MEAYVEEYIVYLNIVKRLSSNTIMSYKRDLIKLAMFAKEHCINKLDDFNKTSLDSFILYLENQGMSTATVSRTIASVKSFFAYLFKKKLIIENPADELKSPKIEKKLPDVVTIEEINRLLNEPSKQNPKEIRDRAMLELLYATGMRVSELIALRLGDINIAHNYILCRNDSKERVIPIDNKAKNALEMYITTVRTGLCENSDYLFTNLKGTPMTRQGFWKLIKFYAVRANINKVITPHMIRHSFATHLIVNGADIKAVQEMLGHADISTTQMYLQARHTKIKLEYDKAHPRAKE